ncbi:MAG: LOG family protein [Planctomycetota bacterium]|nr:MAG: LOG family protein [Planctomycetota bacterium]
MLETCLKLVADRAGTGELKLIRSALKELRHAYRVFALRPETRKISIFGSARTPPAHPDYAAARAFSRAMAQAGWEVITGAGDGIMKAGHEGPGREASFGLAIRLPFETTANEIIQGDSKLINFRYFFTRKLIFVSQADAVAVLPGGFGTHDELFEVLTLIQTGKSVVVPVVLLEGEGGDFWGKWEEYVEQALLAGAFISPEDLCLHHRARSVEEAVEHVRRFYRIYHSSRYVRDLLVIRLKRRLRDQDVQRLSKEFAEIIASGSIEQREALPEEKDHLELPRLVFHHTKHKFGLLRRLIDRINECEPMDAG